MSLPLAGTRVLDLSRLLPGGFCSLLLADFGADVLKVEDTGMGDYIRWSPPYYEGAHESARSALFLALNRNKRSIRLDLKHERGREALLRLVRDYDVVLESFRPGVLDRLGVGYERMREQNPGIVYCAISGYGQDGPKRDASGHDMNYLGLIGLLGLTGERGGAPVQAGGQIADLGGGALMAAFGILAALRERDGGGGRPGSGEGQLVDVSMADGALSWLAMVAADLLRRRRRAPPRRLAAGRLAGLLPPLRVRRRLGHARRARAQVLAGLLPRRRSRGPDRRAVPGAGLARPRAGQGDLQGRARASSGRRSRASTTAAWSPCWSSTRRSTPSSCGRARWSWRSSSRAPSARCARSACPSSSRAPPAITRGCPAPRSASTPRRCCSRPATPSQDVAELLADGAAAGAAGERSGGQQDMSFRA